VVQLVRRGLRNKEIARELFVSLRTVEVRLTRIYHRVGVTSRAHLIAQLAASDLASGGAPDSDRVTGIEQIT
jgi:DNA-binding NarL/FixJ family response regulator